MRTGRDTEYIVTEFVTPTTQNAYILVAIQSCKFTNPMDELLGEEEEAKEWSNEYENTEKTIICMRCMTGLRSQKNTWLSSYFSHDT